MSAEKPPLANHCQLWLGQDTFDLLRGVPCHTAWKWSPSPKTANLELLGRSLDRGIECPPRRLSPYRCKGKSRSKLMQTIAELWINMITKWAQRDAYTVCDGGLSKSEDIWGKRPFSSVFWIFRVLFVPSGKGQKRQKKGEKGRFRPISRKGGQTPLKPPFVTPPFAAAQFCSVLRWLQVMGAGLPAPTWSPVIHGMS